MIQLSVETATLSIKLMYINLIEFTLKLNQCLSLWIKIHVFTKSVFYSLVTSTNRMNILFRFRTAKLEKNVVEYSMPMLLLGLTPTLFRI